MLRRVVRLTLAVVILLATGCGYQSCGMLDWSPDGKRLVTSLPFGPQVFGLVTVDVATGAVGRIPGGEYCAEPSWSPNGRYIAAIRTDKKGTQLRLVDLRRGTSRVVVAEAGGPSIWSDDSSTLFTVKRWRGASTGVWYSVATGEVLAECAWPVDADSGNHDVGHWIPGTNDVALVAQGNVFRTDGQQAVQLTYSGKVVGLGLTGDRQALVWASTNDDNSGLALSRCSLSSGEVRRLPLRSFIPEGCQVGSVAFAAGGRWMVAHLLKPTTRSETATGSSRKRDVNWELVRCVVARVDGTAARTVWSAVPFPPRQPVDVSTTFSHDGKRLAIAIARERIVEVRVAAVDGTGLRTVMSRRVPRLQAQLGK